MNTRLRKTFGFYTGMVYDSRFLVNHYNLELNLLTVSKDNIEQNIAYERMKYWIYNVIDDSILISADSDKLSAFENTGSRLLVLPCQPVDQIIGIMLYLKLNAIMENRIVVTSTEIWSTQGDSMSYLHNHEENLGADLAQDGWWVDSRPTWQSQGQRVTRDKIVSLDRMADWKDFDLGWGSPGQDIDKRVVFADFARDEDQ